MAFDEYEFSFDKGQTAGAQWKQTLLEAHGLHCDADPQAAVSSALKRWKLGPVGVTRAELVGQALSPVADTQPSWPGEWMFVKLVESGFIDFEHGNSVQRFEAGSMLIVDPARHFKEMFPVRTQLTTLRISKANLRARGARSSIDGYMVANTRSADVLAVRDLIRCVAGQFELPSQKVRHRMGEHLQDLVDVLLGEPDTVSHHRAGDTLLLRAKRYIETHFGDEALDADAVARSVHVSSKHLQRIFAASGTSLMRYVWHVRLAHAERLLRTSDARTMPAQEIAWRCGFSSASHFSRVFKQRFGVSPGDVRAMQGKDAALSPAEALPSRE